MTITLARVLGIKLTTLCIVALLHFWKHVTAVAHHLCDKHAGIFIGGLMHSLLKMLYCCITVNVCYFAQDDDHMYRKRYRQIRKTRKLGCPALAIIKECVFFPDFKVLSEYYYRVYIVQLCIVYDYYCFCLTAVLEVFFWLYFTQTSTHLDEMLHSSRNVEIASRVPRKDTKTCTFVHCQ